MTDSPSDKPSLQELRERFEQFYSMVKPVFGDSLTAKHALWTTWQLVHDGATPSSINTPINHAEPVRRRVLSIADDMEGNATEENGWADDAKLLREVARSISAPSATLTPDEAEDAAKAVRNSLNPAGGLFIARGWNVLLDKLDAIAAQRPERKSP